MSLFCLDSMVSGSSLVVACRVPGASRCEASGGASLCRNQQFCLLCSGMAQIGGLSLPPPHLLCYSFQGSVWRCPELTMCACGGGGSQHDGNAAPGSSPSSD